MDGMCFGGPVRHWCLSALLGCLFLACQSSVPTPFEDPKLGVRAVFPGAPSVARYQEETPFGAIEWFGASYASHGGMGATFHFQVGNLPPGNQGGGTETAVLATFEKWLHGRYPGMKREDLPLARGVGFRYGGASTRGGQVSGVLILRNGRLHHAQAVVSPEAEIQAKAFLDSFQILK